MSKLNSSQFSPATNRAPDLPFTPEPLPGESTAKPIAKELPLLTPEQRSKQRDEVMAKKAESGKTVVVGKPQVFTAVNRTAPVASAEETAAKEAADRAERQKALDVGFEIENKLKPIRQTPRAVVQNVLGGTVLKGHGFGVPEDASVPEGPTPGNKFSVPRMQARRVVPAAPKPAINEELRAETGIEAPAPVSIKVGLRQMLKEKAAKEAGSPEAVKSFTRKELDAGARSLARTHWEKTAPKADLSGYYKEHGAWSKAHKEWLAKNPVPASGTPEREEWSKNYSDWKSSNPMPSTKPLDDARAYTDTLFKQSEAFKAPHQYLKKVLGVANKKAVDVHVNRHLKELKAADLASEQELKASREVKPEKPKLDLASRPEISPERSAGVETFAKNPLAFHFGKGNSEGRG